jgi:hypothetical protein
VPTVKYGEEAVKQSSKQQKVGIWRKSHMDLYNHYFFKEGGRTQIARHNLDVFEGGGPVKCWQAFIFFNCVLFARFHFSRSPHSLRDFICFL